MERVVGMKPRIDGRRWGFRALLIALLVLASGGAWIAGRASGQDGQGAAAPPAAGYDLGVAGKPRPTGQVREFQLVAKEATWELVPGVAVPAITYNGQVPGPTIRVTEGDTLRVTLTNELRQATAIHWHGLHVPNAMDGVPPFTQPAIEPGQRFTYEFVASHAGSFMYHSHLNAVEQIDRGLYGVLIIDPATPPPARFDKEFTMLLSAWDTTAAAAGGHAMPGGGSMPGQAAGMGGMAMDYNYFTINGKAFPANEAWTAREGELLRVRIINISNVVHPMHLHGHDFTVVAKDGEPIRPELQQTMNTIAVNAGETYDVVFRIESPGTWVFHCHELHHTENDGVEPGGLIQVIQTGTTAPAGTGTTPATSPTPMPSKMPGMGH
jgi:manganese oxidase